MQMTIVPKFSSKEYELGLQKLWFEFQEQAFELGQRTLEYMQNYISSNINRRRSSSNLVNTINLEILGTAPAQIGWGVGNISILNAKAKYWYVINYGKTVSGQPFVPNKGKFVPGSFEGHESDLALRQGVEHFNYKDGSGMGMIPKEAIRPINYIQTSRIQLDRELATLIATLKKGL